MVVAESAGKYTFVYRKGLRVMDYVETFAYIRESYQQLRG
jgi:hypothetical protein